jgi:hypothetical protein
MVNSKATVNTCRAKKRTKKSSLEESILCIFNDEELSATIIHITFFRCKKASICRA